MIINSFAGIFIPKHLSHILTYEPRLIVLDDRTDFSELLILENLNRWAPNHRNVCCDRALLISTRNNLWLEPFVILIESVKHLEKILLVGFILYFENVVVK